MRKLLTFLCSLSFAACAGAGDSAPDLEVLETHCEELGVDGCHKSDRCHVVELEPWDSKNACFADAKTGACMLKNVDCQGDDRCQRDEDGQLWLSPGCTLISWPNDDIPANCGKPACKK